MVAIDEGLPGMPSRQEAIRPPDSPPTYTPIIAARPCSGSRPKVNGSTMITVMVLVMPGSPPPMTPTSVPSASGIRYLACSTFSMPASRSSYMSEVRPEAARQEHQQVPLEQDVGDGGSDQGCDAEERPALRPL